VIRRVAALLGCVALLACGGGASPSASSATGGGGSGGFTPLADASTGGGADDGGIEGGPNAASRCTVTPPDIECPSQQIALSDSTADRAVTFATPLGSPPSAGWPAVVFFQGSFVPGHTAFAAAESDSFGRYELTLTVKALLDDGYAVLAPDASSNGSEFWETNIPPYAESWSGSPDDVLMNNLFDAMSKGAFGPIDPTHLYAMGISSGGFMTSRMAVSYPGKMRALADHSGSYATCSATCSVPTPLPSGHPPTLFLHGAADDVVPLSAIQPYLDALTSEGYEAKLVTDPDAGHEWLPEGPSAIPVFFDAHR
jgi:poly(3-hydroxyoctanoate) depolymerase